MSAILQMLLKVFWLHGLRSLAAKEALAMVQLRGSNGSVCFFLRAPN